MYMVHVINSIKFLILTIIVIGIVHILNVTTYKSNFLSAILFVFYIVFIGFWVGISFFKDNEYKAIFGIYLTLCFIITGESVLLISNHFIYPLTAIPFVFLPAILTIIYRKTGKFELRIFSIRNPDYSRKQILLAGLFVICSFGCLLTLFLSRSGTFAFSVFQLVPSYFLLLILSMLIIFIFQSYLTCISSWNSKYLLFALFIIGFTVFGSYLIVFSNGFDADPYSWITAIKHDFIYGYRAEPWRIMPIERGTESIIGSITTMSGEFNTSLAKLFFDCLNPILASIFIPFFLYQFLSKIVPDSKKGYYLIGSLAFLVFPTFWDFIATNSNYLGNIFLFGTLFLILKAFSKPTSSAIIALFLSFLATAFIHPISAVYSVMALLLASPFLIELKYPKSSNYLNHKFRRIISIINSNIIYIIATLITSAIPLIALLYGNNILSVIVHLQLSPIATLKSTVTLSDFASAFTPIWALTPFTASKLIGEGYNYIRIIILFLGFYSLSQKKALGRVRIWIAMTAISYFLAYFFIITLLQRLDHDPYRFALSLDIMLLPLAGLLIHDLFQKLTTLRIEIRVRKFRRLFLIASIILTGVLILLPVQLMLSLPNYPMRFASEQPLLGRPTARAVSNEEIDALNYIGDISNNYTVIASDEFLAKIAQGTVVFREFEGQNNIISDPAAISKIISNNNFAIAEEIGRSTNSSTIFLIFNDWYLRVFGLSINNIEKFTKSLNLVGGLLITFGRDYVVYLVQIDVTYHFLAPPIIEDRSKSNHDGIVNGNLLSINGIKGSAVNFYDGNSIIKANNSENLQFNQITVESWVYLDNDDVYSNPICSKWLTGADPSNDQFILSMYPTRNEIYFYISDGSKISYAQATVCPTFEWIHLVATYDGKNIRLYINGSVVAESEWQGHIATASMPLVIGGSNPLIESQYFKGYIDEVSIYRRSLNQSEILYDYLNVRPLSTEDLILWYSFD
jgi:hypothetical protein